jgi:hypothetical protein
LFIEKDRHNSKPSQIKKEINSVWYKIESII